MLNNLVAVAQDGLRLVLQDNRCKLIALFGVIQLLLVGIFVGFGAGFAFAAAIASTPPLPW